MLDQSTYFAPENELKYVSASQLRAFYSCEAAALHNLFHPEEFRAAMDEKKDIAIGKYVDAALLTPEELPEVIRRHDSVLLLASGKDAAPLTLAKQMVARAQREPKFMAALSGIHQHVIEFQIGGIPAKAMLDVCDPDSGKIGDVKTAPEVCEDGTTWFGGSRSRWYDAYNGQLAIYMEAYRQKYKEMPWMLLLAGISKQTPPQLALVDFSCQKSRLKHEFEIIAQQAPRVDKLKRGEATPCRCEKCAFCRADGVLEYTVEDAIGDM